MLSILCSLSSSSGTHTMKMLLHFMLFLSSLRLSSLFLMPFSFCFSDRVLFFYLVFQTLIQSSALCNLLFLPSSVFLISDMLFFISDWSFSIVSMSFFMLLYLSLSSAIILLTITLNSMSDKLLASNSFSSFSRNFFCCFIWGLFFVSPFRLSLCVFFYVLDKSSMTPSLCEVALCSRYPVRPNILVSLVS